MLSRARRLRAAPEWRDVRRRGRCVSGASLTLCVLPSPSAERYGFSTTRGFRTAVARNRARRRLREAFKAVYREGGAPRLFIGVAKPAALSLSFEELKMEVDTQLARLDRPDASRKARAR